MSINANQSHFRSRGTPGDFIEYLQKNIATNKGSTAAHIAIQQEVRELAKVCSNPQAFLHKCEDLKQKKYVKIYSPQ